MLRLSMIGVLLWLTAGQWTHAQEYALAWHLNTDLDHRTWHALGLPQKSDWPIPSDTLFSWVNTLRDEAYLEASVDTLWKASDTTHIELHLGPTYSWSYLNTTGIPAQLSEGLSLREQTNKPVSPRHIQEIFEQVLRRAENIGYPFAAIKLTQIGIKKGLVEAAITVNLNQEIKIERIKVDGDLKLSERYLHHYLDIEEGDLFAKQKFLQARDRLKELTFLKAYKEPVVDFLGNGATLQFYLDKKNANQFDILLGLLPAPNNPQRRFQLTGNVNIDLQNQFGSGEIIHFNYESLQPGTQEIEIDLNYPFIFKLPFGVDLDFDLYKRDSSYIDIGYEIGIQYFLQRSNYVKFFTSSDRTNLLTIDTSAVKRTKKLPRFIDISDNQFGAEYHLEKLDYRLNPRKGFDITLTASAGTRKIEPNSTIINLQDDSEEPFDFRSLYNDLALNSFKYKLTTQLVFYMPLFKSSALKFAQSTGYLGSSETLYDNELFRIGGIKLLRGFNEEVIFANFYSVTSLEYRLLFNQNSNLFVFTDVGYVEQLTQQVRRFDLPLGFGVGLNLETSVGIFSISYAIGGQRNNPIDFSNGRVHFGMVAGF